MRPTAEGRPATATTTVWDTGWPEGIGFALAGLLLSIFFVRESHGHVRHEATLEDPSTERATPASFGAVFRTTSWSPPAVA